MNRSVLILLVSVLLPWSTQAAPAPKPGPFAEFAGTYRGSALMSNVLGGKSTMKFAVPRNGNSGVLTVDALVSTIGINYDVSNVFRLSKTSFSASKLSPPNLGGPAPRGRLSASRTVLRGSARPDSTLLVTFKATLRKSRKLARLTVDYQVFTNGLISSQLVYDATRRVRS